MTTFPQTIILRHRKENLKKCSLRGLEGRDDFLFFTYPQDLDNLPSLGEAICLSFEGPPLSLEDRHCPLLVLDGTWKLATKMERALEKKIPLKRRSLPKGVKTAYPRVQNGCVNPAEGLATIEAIFVAYTLLGHQTKGLLDNYHWKELFLQMHDFATIRPSIEKMQFMKKSAAKKTRWQWGGIHALLPGKKGGRPLATSELLFQFFLHEFLLFNEAVTALNTLSPTAFKETLKKLLGSNLSFALSSSSLDTPFPLGYLSGLQSRLQDSWLLLIPTLKRREAIASSKLEELSTILNRLSASIKQCAYTFLSYNELPGNTTLDPIWTMLEEFTSAIPSFLSAFRYDEGVLFFLLSHHKKMDALFGANFVFTQIELLFSGGLVGAITFLKTRYLSRGFAHLIPTIDELATEVSPSHNYILQTHTPQRG